MLRSARMQAGVTLIEMLIALVIVGLLLTFGAPWFGTFLQNTKIKNGAQSTLAGLDYARAEAVRRNAYVRFQLVSDLTSGCVLGGTTATWVVSLLDPTGGCNESPWPPGVAFSSTYAHEILQKQGAAEGAASIQVASIGGSTVTFNGLGRVVGTGITQLDFTNPAGSCQPSGEMRCMRILVSPGGQTKLCDPAVTDGTDPRHC